MNKQKFVLRRLNTELLGVWATLYLIVIVRRVVQMLSQRVNK